MAPDRNKRTPITEQAKKTASEIVEKLIDEHLPELIAYCRREILARPRLAKMAEEFKIKDSDDWLKQAIALLNMCMVSCMTPAVEWHDEVGGLQVGMGLDIVDADDTLFIVRDGVLNLIWDGVSKDKEIHDRCKEIVTAVLSAVDCGLDAQNAAYVRESQRRLSETNKDLEDRKNLFERDLALARVVQQQFIPRNYVSSNFRAEVRYVPTISVGGDHAGIFTISPSRIFVTICDVTGHGIASALVSEIVSSRLRQSLRAQMETTFQYAVEPVEIVRELNRLFYEEFQPLGMLLSFFVAMLDSVEGRLVWSGAGHPPPVLQCCSAHNLVELRSQNIILGAAEDCVIGAGQDSIEIHTGDRVIFYTDGIIEANNARGKMLGMDGLRTILQDTFETPQQKLADQLIQVARKAYGKNPETDDMTVIVLDVLKAGSEEDDRRFMVSL